VFGVYSQRNGGVKFFASLRRFCTLPSLRPTWTRTQRIRTAGALPFEVVLVDTEEEPPVYQRIATKALHLRELGLSDRVIAQRLGVSDKTVGKAIRWLGGLSP
jgi:hypothetical protein